MKTITLKEAYQLLEESSAVVVDDAVLYPSLADLSGEAENEFLYLSWTDSDYHEFSLKFSEGDNQTVKVSGSSLFLYDTDANDDSDLTQITILQPQPLE